MITMSMLLFSSIAITMFMAMNPISLGMMILLMALILSMSFAYSMSSWVAFLIFLIDIGGMFVMFSYFVAIIPYQNLSIMHIMISMSLFTTSMVLISKMMNINPPLLQLHSSNFNILYTSSNMFTLILLASILLFTMIVVMKLTMLSKGPLRPFS